MTKMSAKILSRVTFACIALALLTTAILRQTPKWLNDFDQRVYLSIAYDIDRHGVFSNGGGAGAPMPAPGPAGQVLAPRPVVPPLGLRGGINAAAATAIAGKVGRNEPCPCGSGRKYKKCHGR